MNYLKSVRSLVSSRYFSTTTRVLNNEAATTTSKTSSGLYQFFENGEALPKPTFTGRSWKANELRLKSFDDLHKLWYVLLKERNLLATQREEARRLKVHKEVWTNSGRMKKCQKSMARIKFVLNERQRAYETAIKDQQLQPKKSAPEATIKESPQ
ncbi:MRP-L47-domain-containing protein [Hesseltinella vesiculosa]|uniref:Large ribosomal subunit protein uL29m n=1 Tax=Hesseltinella vesiculosa TaxID=101127 RepID=A0A1X2GIJ0_9FUNG|nr:MRP-L47-domain-containing protein [Hesseltinella vesiculosa]